MALATALSQTFNMPVSQVTGGAGQGRYGQEREAQGSVLGAPPTGLQNVDNVTRDFYQKWADLENFAADMKMRFGIDVTKPDFSSQEAMEAHEMFQKGAADLHYQTNKLKQAQEDLTLANKAMAGSQGYRYSMNGDPTQQVYDPSMLEMAPPEEKLGNQRRTTAEELDLYRRKKAIDAQYKTTDGKTPPTIKGVETYEGIAKTLVDAMNGNVGWETAEDAEGNPVLNSPILNGGKYGDKEIRGIVRKGDKTYLQYGKYDIPEEIEITEDNFEPVFRRVVEGTKGLRVTDADAYLDSVEDILSLASEDTGGLAEAQKQLQVVQAKKNISDFVTTELSEDKVNSFSEEIRAAVEEKLKGKEYEGSKIKSVVKETGWGEGKYRIVFEDGEVINFGGAAKNNNEEVREMIKNLGVDIPQVETQTEEEILPETIFVVGDEEYTFQQLLDAGNSKEDILKEAKRK